MSYNDETTLSVLDLGSVVLETKNPAHRFACSSLTYEMAINQIPSAMVVVGVGDLLLMTKKNKGIDPGNNAEDLMNVAAAVNIVRDYVSCSIYIVPRSGEEEKVIFKGVIVGASLLFKTGTPTVRAVRFECMNSACMLYAQPLAAYQIVSGADIVSGILSNTVGAPTEGDAAGKIGMLQLASITAEAVCERLGESILRKDIATRIAKMIDAIVMMSSHTFNSIDYQDKDFGSLLGVSKYIQSAYSLNSVYTGTGTITEDRFNLELCAALLRGVPNVSILDLIIRTLSSDDYMLSVVPRFGGDFMLDIVPYKAWDLSTAFDINFSEISEINSIYRPLDHLNDPNICVVDYSDSLNFGGITDLTGTPSSMLGVYSTDKDAAKWIAERLNAEKRAKEQKKLVQDTAHYKFKTYKAPRWMNFAYIKSKYKDSKDMREQIENQRMKENSNSSKKDSGVDYDYKRGQEIADMLAEMMFITKHGASNTSTIKLSPRLLFGADKNRNIENHIGQVINVLPSEDRKNENTQIEVRGMLSSVRFTYNAGASASCSYEISLTRVRRYDKKEKSIICPLYTQITKK